MIAGVRSAGRMTKADPLPWLGRLLAPGPSASADLYFRFSHADLVEGGVVERHAPTVFRWGRTLIVVRHDGGLSRLPDHDRVVLVVDDDWRGGVGDPNLPWIYRIQLGLRDGRAGRRLEAAADVIVASCEALAQVLRDRNLGKDVTVIEPVWAGPRAELSDRMGPHRRIAVLGATSHRCDVRWLEPVLVALARTRPDLGILWSGNHPLPAALAQKVEVTIVPTMNWDGYRSWIAGMRADIGLYALRPGPFNHARSVNKLGEYDRMGAAVVGSDIWTAANEAERAGACLLLPSSPSQWVKALQALIDRPDQILALARRNREWQDMRGCLRQRRQWARLLSNLMDDHASSGSRFEND